MTNHVFLSQSALEDMQNALDWYAEQSEGLEQRFHKAVTERLKFIAKYPEASPVRAVKYRGVQLKKFPYALYYDYDEANSIVQVTAILHDKMDKSILKRR
jgi:toxin ParE1/3/4